MSKPALLIAVVDDEEPVRRALHRLLRSAGLTVEAFESGHDFLSSLATHHPDCIILDLHMPAINGFDIQARLNQLHSTIPTIIITGHDSPESRTRALNAGASAFLPKPVDGQMLLDEIEKAVSNNETN